MSRKVSGWADVMLSYLPDDQKLLFLNNFDVNICTLKEHRPNLYKTVIGFLPTFDFKKNLILFDPNEGYCLYEERSGFDNVLLTTGASAINRYREISSKCNSGALPESFLFLGHGLGFEAFTLNNDGISYSDAYGFKPSVHILEPDIQYFIINMMLFDLSSMLMDSNNFISIGDNCFNFFYDYALKKKKNFFHNSLLVALSFSEFRDKYIASFIEFSDRARSYFNFHEAEVENSLMSYYSSFPLKNNKKVAFIQDAHVSYQVACANDIAKAFAHLGFEVDFALYYGRVENYKFFILSKIDYFKPDFIFSINHHRPSFVPKNIPFFTWIQDTYNHLVDYEYSINDCVSTLSSKWFTRIKSNKVYELPLGFSCQKYFKQQGVKKEIDVLYVSNLPVKRLTLQGLDGTEWLTHQELNYIAKRGDSALYSAYQAIFAALNDCDNHALEKMFDSDEDRLVWLAQFSFFHQYTDMLDIFLGRCRFKNEILFQLKTRPISSLIKAGIDVQVYGRNWEDYIEFNRVNRGYLKDDQANVVNNKSKICIQNTMELGLHMRALEAMGSGSFMLTRFIEKSVDLMPLDTFFESDRDFSYFYDEDDLVKKVNYFLNNDEERERIASNGCFKCTSKAEYTKTVDSIIEILNSHYHYEVEIEHV